MRTIKLNTVVRPYSKSMSKALIELFKSNIVALMKMIHKDIDEAKEELKGTEVVKSLPEHPTKAQRLSNSNYLLIKEGFTILEGIGTKYESSRALEKALEVIFKVVINSNGRREVDTNALINGIAKAFDVSDELTGTYLQTIALTCGWAMKKHKGTYNSYWVLDVKGHDAMIAEGIVVRNSTSKDYINTSGEDTEIDPTHAWISTRKAPYTQQHQNETSVEFLDIVTNKHKFKFREVDGKTLYNAFKESKVGDGVNPDKLPWLQPAFKVATEEYVSGLEKPFTINRFLDGVGRCYEASTNFGFQKHEKIKSIMKLSKMKRFSKKGKEWQLAYLNKEEIDGRNDWIMEEVTAMKPILIEVDALSSGPQIMAAGTKDIPLMSYTGLFGTTHSDLYIAVRDTFENMLLEDGYITTTGIFPRKVMKPAVFKLLYNSSVKTIVTGSPFGLQAAYDELIERGSETDSYKTALYRTVEELGLAIPADVMCSYFYKSMWAVAPAAMKYLQYVNHYSKQVKEYRLSKGMLPIYEWENEDKFISQYIPMEVQPTNIPFFDKDGMLRHFTYSKSVRSTEERGVSARMTQSVDAYIQRTVVIRAHKEGIHMGLVHDAYFVHPNDAERLTQIYQEVLAELVDTDFVTNMVKSMVRISMGQAYANKVVPVGKGVGCYEDTIKAKGALGL